MTVKSQTSVDLVNKVGALEARSDLWAENNELFRREWNLAAWTGLTACARALELEIPLSQRGGSLHQTAVTNISATAYQLYMAARRHGKTKAASCDRFYWTVSESLMQHTLRQAYSYAMFCADFPAWHKDVHSLVRVGDHEVTFEAAAIAKAQRFMAYEKGIRPFDARPRRAPETEIEPDSELDAEIAALAASMSAVNTYSFRHDPLSELNGLLYSRYDKMLTGNFRRSPNLDMGGYSLLEVRRFFAALLALAGAKEHICYLWQRAGHLWPCNDLLLIYSKASWVQKISSLATITRQTAESILDDMTIGRAEAPNRNFSMYPFAPLDNEGKLLAIIPGIVMASNSEENMLRICSAKNKCYADIASTAKEDEARNDLQNISANLRVFGPIKLRKGMPDVDCILAEESTNSLLIAELKWLQTPMTLLAREERNKELRKGIKQIALIKSFLQANPDFLVQTGRMERSLSTYSSVTYAVVCRDYIADVDASAALFSYAALRRKLAVGKASLPEAIAFASSDEWLPMPGTDYKFERTSLTCNGVTVASGIFVPLYPESLDIMEPPS